MSKNVSRRAFLQSSALTTAVTTLAGAAAVATQTSAHTAASKPREVGPEPTPVTFVINGSASTLMIEPRMTLAQVLRETAGLTGTKIACDRGACSACTVLLDGAPVNSCMLLAVEAAGHEVTTIEGLASGEELHPVQAAFIEHDALQCGYCTPGMVISCAALLARVKDPTPEDVKAAISGHLCRCGTYPHVITATVAAAKARAEQS
ncbi:MAG TPA: (2Fe-2S)-binding protein [Steroidobacteraceae bacterium]|nr:(2Fe-2S)-binding protein [Steroidobacteraceae bacterium]